MNIDLLKAASLKVRRMKCDNLAYVRIPEGADVGLHVGLVGVQTLLGTGGVLLYVRSLLSFRGFVSGWVSPWVRRRSRVHACVLVAPIQKLSAHDLTQ